MIIVAPFSMLFGLVATEAGLTIAQVLGFSVVVVAGAAQFAALQLMVDEAPTLIVLTTALVVNLRMAMYSAALAPHLGAAPLWQRIIVAYCNFDQSFAVGQMEFERRPEMPLSDKLAYFFGVAVPLFVIWYSFTLIGAIFGAQVPPSFALDFAVPITFLALVAPALKSLAHVAAAGTSIVLALALVWMPSGLGLIIAALAAMAVGAEVERRM